MSEARRNQILQQFRRPPPHKPSRSKEVKSRLHHVRSKETFLTDTQNSDYTRSSGQINLPRTSQLEETIRKLEKQNGELKQRIVELKTNQFYEINQQKLKGIIQETERLKQELEDSHKQLEQSLVERDFLERFNRNLKAQCESLTQQILKLRGNNGAGSISPSQGEPRKTDRNIYTSREEGESGGKSRRSFKQEVSPYLNHPRKEGHPRRKEKSKDEGGISTSHTLLKTSTSASRLHEDYYGKRRSRSRRQKQI